MFRVIRGCIGLAAICFALIVQAQDFETVKRAAEQGDVKAQYLLGTMYAQGRGVTQNRTESAKWIQKAAEQGNAQARTSLGFLYAEGLGVTQNYTEAAKWFRLAAEQGNADAQAGLGFLCENGLGIAKNLVEAAKWYSKAAEQGNANAKAALGEMHDEAAQPRDSAVETLSSEIQQAIILSAKLRSAANIVNNTVWIGTINHEIDLKEHTCYSLGLLVGQPDSVRHLRLNRNPSLKAADSDEAFDLRVIARSLDNFVGAAKHAKGLSPQERIQEWNLDCVGQLGIKGRFIETTGESTFYRLKNNGEVLQVLGKIEQGFAARLRAAIEANPRVRIIALGSGGGLVSEALEAGWYIRFRGLETTLWNNCFSACPLVFLGGVERSIWSPYPFLGFHKIYTESGAVPLTSPVYQEISEYVRQMGASPQFVLGKMFSAEPSQMSVVRDTRDLCDNKIATWIQRRCSSKW